jgi:ADP-ribose pyrophosphatase YjhB (NUDIX family)
VVLQPVREDTGRMALLVIRRAIEPCLGQLALPGGFVDYDEDWREAARRELWEETGIALEGGAAALQLFEVLSKRPGNRLVLFAVAPALECLRCRPSW